MVIFVFSSDFSGDNKGDTSDISRSNSNVHSVKRRELTKQRCMFLDLKCFH